MIEQIERIRAELQADSFREGEFSGPVISPPASNPNQECRFFLPFPAVLRAQERMPQGSDSFRHRRWHPESILAGRKSCLDAGPRSRLRLSKRFH